MILSLYNTMLEKSYYNTDDKLTRLSSVLSDYRYFEDKIVAIDGFTRFTKQEYAVVEKILSQSPQTYITFDSDGGKDAILSLPTTTDRLSCSRALPIKAL